MADKTKMRKVEQLIDDTRTTVLNSHFLVQVGKTSAMVDLKEERSNSHASRCFWRAQAGLKTYSETCILVRCFLDSNGLHWGRSNHLGNRQGTASCGTVQAYCMAGTRVDQEMDNSLGPYIDRSMDIPQDLKILSITRKKDFWV